MMGDMADMVNDDTPWDGSTQYDDYERWQELVRVVRKRLKKAHDNYKRNFSRNSINDRMLAVQQEAIVMSLEWVLEQMGVDDE